MSQPAEPTSVRRRAVLKGMAGLAVTAGAGPGVAQTQSRPDALRGFNLIETLNAPFGSPAAAMTMRAMRDSGANAVALVPFLWQASAASPDIVLGDALPLDRLRAGIGQARAAGLAVVLKPHVWVPGAWAGAVTMANAGDWRRWFAGYRRIVTMLAQLAAEESVDQLVVGTELRHAAADPAWKPLIAEVRSLFRGPLLYVAHGADEAEATSFWRDLDAVGVSLYPALGPARDKGAWHRAMAAELGRVHAVAERAGRPLWVGEIGIRSANDATLKPWESAEERAAAPDPQLQAHVIGAWLHELAKAPPAATFVWRWLTDPGAGGPQDTDFTVQGKPAVPVIRAQWIRSGTRAQR